MNKIEVGSMKRKSKKIITSIVFFIIVIYSCEDIDISERWAVNKFKEETGLNEGCTIDSVKRYAGQACIFASLTDSEMAVLKKRFKFVSKEDFLKAFRLGHGLPIFKELLDIDTLSNDHVYFLKTYTNSSGMIATSCYTTILSKRDNKIIFTEAFYDL